MDTIVRLITLGINNLLLPLRQFLLLPRTSSTIKLLQLYPTRSSGRWDIVSSGRYGPHDGFDSGVSAVLAENTQCRLCDERDVGEEAVGEGGGY